MPRPLVYGNGHLLVNVDARLSIRDIYWPHVGMPNHVQGFKCQMGVWVDGEFSWLSDTHWQISLSFEPNSGVGKAEVSRPGLPLKLVVREGVDLENATFVREIQVISNSDESHDVRFFFTQDLRLNESDIGDTALYHAESDSVVHYKGRTAILFTGCSTTDPTLHSYTTGLTAFGTHYGSAWDAEDGELHRSPINQGSVDSCISIRVQLAPRARETAVYSFALDKSLDRVLERRRHELVNPLWLPDVLRGRHDVPFECERRAEGLPPRIAEQFTRSVQIIKTQIDARGAILAATDSDILSTNRATYCYLWPRDGALVARAMDLAGCPEVAINYFDFCVDIMPEYPPMYLHKYAPDGTLGASWHPWVRDGVPHTPFQQDETALTVMAIGQHLRRYPNPEKAETWFRMIVEPAADYMVGFVENGLPKPSYDLWEERFGVHTYTVVSVIAALREAAFVCGLVAGNPAGYQEAEARMRNEFLFEMWDDESGRFMRRYDEHGSQDWTVDAALLSAVQFGVMEPNSRAAQLIGTIEKHLWIDGGIGGLARYQGDYYFRRTEDFAGNPWLITTLWLAQAKMILAKTPAELDETLKLLEWACDRAGETGVMAEQFDPYTGEPLSVAPLTWSHAEFVGACMMYRERRDELNHQ